MWRRMGTTRPFILAGSPVASRVSDVVTDRYSGRAAFRVAVPQAAHIEKAIAAGLEAERAMREMPAFARAQVLAELANRIEARRRDFERLLCTEAGKPLRDSRTEIERALITCRLASEEATRITGEYLPLDNTPRSAGFEGMVMRVPVGLCSFITPFNFPLNLVMHKVAPAIACGCPFVLKPAPQTPMTALLLGQLLTGCEPALPRGAFSVLPARVDDAAPLVQDERIKLLSFTGSAAVGWMLKSKAGRKKVTLELGGNAACVVDEGVDVRHAAERITFGAFYQSGQSCISVQRLVVHSSLYDRMKRELVKRAKALKAGDPKREDTFLGPLISPRDVQRVLEWIEEAKRGGAKILCSPTPGLTKEAPDRAQRFLSATIVENPPRSSRLWRQEAFGPVLTIEAFDDFSDAITAVNDSRYGLQAGVFTNNLLHARQAWQELQVGAVVINDVPSVRLDSMPYGGVKDSGLGREGVRSAIMEMTEPRVMLTRRTFV
jgi:acyl-CoA reductase-like NAD-dependent aldehyde dehydrogenase